MSSLAYRLPKNIRPIQYDVELRASPQRKTFQGQVSISAQVAKATAVVELHSHALKIENVTIQFSDQYFSPHRVKHHKARQTMEIVLPQNLGQGKISIHIRYTGKLNNNLHGLYLAQDGRDRAIVSQCEPTDARTIFPCFDEPDFKAKIRWCVISKPGLKVITNGLFEKRELIEKEEKHYFKTSEVIPTYLAAVTIGNFVSSDRQFIQQVPCQFWCTPAKLAHTKFASQVTEFVLPWYQNYFGHPYHYHKLDQVAVPGFDAGAMENVGAIFYRQNYLLMESQSTSWSTQKRVAEVIAHEIAHMWFGNLVTMSWWDDLWLNEAFATWMSYKVLDAYQPEWGMWDEFLKQRESALNADALKFTHAIYSEVATPAEALELFDVITYEKGCSVLRMVEGYVGPKKFRNGVRSYIQKFKNANACRQDLWNELARSTREPIDKLMQLWVAQPGFPLISIGTKTHPDGTLIHIQQRRLMLDPKARSKEDDTLWQVPIGICYEDNLGTRTHRVLLTEREKTFLIPGPHPVKWLFPNINAVGFYRCQFDERTLRNLLQKGFSHLNPSERASLLTDQWTLVQCALNPLDRFLDVLRLYQKERHALVTQFLSTILLTIDNFLVDDCNRSFWQDFVTWLLEVQFSELGWIPDKDESHFERSRRANLIFTLVAICRHRQYLDHVDQLLEQEIAAPKTLEPNLAMTIVQLGALANPENNFPRFVEQFQLRCQKRTAPELQMRYLKALGRFETDLAIKTLFGYCLDGTIPQEQINTILVPLLGNRRTALTTWRGLKKHWPVLRPRLGSMGISILIEALGALPLHLKDDMIDFFTQHPVEEARQTFQRVLETHAIRAQLIERERDHFSDWLRNQIWLDSFSN